MASAETSVLVCGNYGRDKNQADGQTAKTRTLRGGFADALGDHNVRALNSSEFARSPLHFLRTARCGIKESSLTVILPGPRGLQLFLPLFLHWKRRWDHPLHYVVIGGWLPQLLARKGWLRRLCMQLDGIYVETTGLAEELKRLDLSGVQVLPNFRKFDRNVTWSFAPPAIPLKLVFYSRVMREKGVEDAIAAVQLLNAQDVTHPRASLDIYGPIVERYRRDFRRCLGASDHVNYCGVLSPDNPYDVLQAYDLMLLPTYYEGEGFPGALLDAYVAGVPVVTSDWKHNREIVDEEKTGLLCRARSVEDIVSRVETFIANPARIMEMRQHCLEKARNYHVDLAIQQLLRDAHVQSQMHSGRGS